MDLPFEILLAVDGEYAKLETFHEMRVFDTPDYSYVENVIDHALGEYILYLENDWYWTYNDGLIVDAMDAIEKYDIDLLRLFSYHGGCEYEVLTDRGRALHQLPQHDFVWHFNPSLSRKDRRIKTSSPMAFWKAESFLRDKAKEEKIRSFEFLEDSFHHLGMINHSGGIEQSLRALLQSGRIKEKEDIFSARYFKRSLVELGLKGNDLIEDFVEDVWRACLESGMIKQ